MIATMAKQTPHLFADPMNEREEASPFKAESFPFPEHPVEHSCGRRTQLGLSLAKLTVEKEEVPETSLLKPPR